MNILLIEDDVSDAMYFEEILPSSEITVFKDLPKSLDQNYDLIITDYYLKNHTIQPFLDDLASQDLNIPLIIVSGKVSDIQLDTIPSKLNAIILSKNDHLSKVLTYYVSLIAEDEPVKNIVDYKTLCLDIIHDLKNDLVMASIYQQAKEANDFSGYDKEELVELVVESAVFASERLKELSTYINTETDEFGSLTQAFSKISGSHFIQQHKDSILLQNDCDEEITYIPLFFVSIIIKNLIENSCKYADPSRDLKVELSYHETENQGVISIKDNALGMSEENSRKLFRKRMDSNSGLGVGLVVINRIIRSFGGRIKVKSEEGVGTEIVITFTDAQERIYMN